MLFEWSPKVVCGTHGQMKHQEVPLQFICNGFDGEECAMYLTDEEVLDVLDGRPLQRTAAGDFAWTLVSEFNAPPTITLTQEC